MKQITYVLFFLLVFVTLTGISSCQPRKRADAVEVITNHTNPAPSDTSAIILPYIPPGYYTCIQANIDDLLKAYFTHYGNLSDAEMAYDNKIFVFTGIAVQPSMIINEDTFVYSTAVFFPLEKNSVKNLKVGDIIDVVGVNTGPMPTAEGKPLSDWFDSNGRPIVPIVSGWLYFTGCVFCPLEWLRCLRRDLLLSYRYTRCFSVLLSR
jgi:hypothetical protein